MKQRLLGIDFGTKRIGLALSDEKGEIAFPHGVVKNDDHAVRMISGIIEQEGVSTVVIGESVTLSGEDNPVMAQIREFAHNLEKVTNLPVYFQKEHFTSAEAERIQGNSSSLDASAAALILQTFIDTSLQT